MSKRKAKRIETRNDWKNVSYFADGSKKTSSLFKLINQFLSEI